jgi:AraC-like DNA-binding protein
MLTSSWSTPFVKVLGTSYQQLLDQVRSEVARRLLASTDLEAGEIAFLGYEELNSFARAFHGWEGTTPARWREAAKH